MTKQNTIETCNNAKFFEIVLKNLVLFWYYFGIKVV